MERGRVRWHENIGNGDLISELRMFAVVARIDVVANVKAGPAIETARADTTDVVGRQILTEFVPLVCAHPELVAAGPKCNSDGVSNSPRINFLVAAVGIEFKYARAVCFGGVIRNMRLRSNSNIHLLAVA